MYILIFVQICTLARLHSALSQCSIECGFSSDYLRLFSLPIYMRHDSFGSRGTTYSYVWLFIRLLKAFIWKKALSNVMKSHTIHKNRSTCQQLTKASGMYIFSLYTCLLALLLSFFKYIYITYTYVYTCIHKFTHALFPNYTRLCCRLVYTGRFWVYVALLSVHMATLSVYRALWRGYKPLFRSQRTLLQSRVTHWRRVLSHSAFSQTPKTIFRTHRVLLTNSNTFVIKKVQPYHSQCYIQ